MSRIAVLSLSAILSVAAASTALPASASSRSATEAISTSLSGSTFRPASTTASEPEIKTPEDVLAYLAANKDKVSLVARPGLNHNSTKEFPFASTFKLFHLAAYVTAVHKGTIDPEEKVPMATWKAYHLPGTDGGAYDNAVKRLKPGTTVTIDQLVSAMIIESDNASTDYLRHRLGERALIAAAKTGGGPAPRQVNTINGESLRMAGCQKTADQCLADHVAKGGNTTPPTLPDFATQAAWANTVTLAQPRTVAKLINAIARNKYVSAEASALARKHLEWPMRNGFQHPKIAALGTKGGMFPGVLSEAAYYIPKGKGRARTIVLAMRDMSASTWASAVTSYAHQLFLLRLATDPTYFAKVKAALTAPR
ncbi:serine hydrolase [Sinosporangium album]|nr:serine hydrolase [Sinosporangium album]